MTGTTDKVIITMADVLAAAEQRDGAGAYVRVTDDLQGFLSSVLLRLAADQTPSAVFATLHTLLEVGIQTGIVYERKRLHDAVADAAEVDAATFDSVVD